MVQLYLRLAGRFAQRRLSSLSDLIPLANERLNRSHSRYIDGIAENLDRDALAALGRIREHSGASAFDRAAVNLLVNVAAELAKARGRERVTAIFHTIEQAQHYST